MNVELKESCLSIVISVSLNLPCAILKSDFVLLQNLRSSKLF